MEQICIQHQSTGYVVPANYNAPGQIVIAGKAQAAEEAAEEAKKKGAKIVTKLKVSGPFHTALLKPAALRLEQELKKLSLHPMQFPVFTNVTGNEIKDIQEIIPLLTRQVMNPVRWEDIVLHLSERGVDTFIEIGPGKTLCGFVKRTIKGAKICNIEDCKSFEKLCSQF